MRYYVLLLGVFVLTEFVAAETISRSQVVDKIEGMWLGQIVANMAGRPTEGSYSGSSPNPAESVEWVLRGPDSYWPGDDDTDIEYIALDTFETYGMNPTPQQLADQWLDHITSSGIYISNRQAWYLMGDGFLPSETGSRSYNMHWYSIDSQITTEIIGTINPGLIQHAIDTTYTFASISNEGFPIHASQFYSAMYANAYFESDIRTLIENALVCIPQTSRSRQVIQDVTAWYDADMIDDVPDWRATRGLLYDYYGSGSYAKGRYYNWLESTINLGVTIMCLLYGNGDYKQTVQIGVLAGWDCDCNPATAGGILGVINGRSGLPQDLFGEDVCSNRYYNGYRPNLLVWDTINNIANRAADLAENNISQNGGSISLQGDDTIYTIPEDISIVPQPEKPDRSDPKGLVGEAIANGITVTPNAARYNNSSSDLYNINTIIDGVTDNSYNGMRPYYSYSVSGEHWFSLTFSEPIILDEITFYEGDYKWIGINTYIQDNIGNGGYFDDIRVEILVDGEFVSPQNVLQSEPLIRTKMYQTISFEFEPVVTDTFRIIGSPGGLLGYTTILELEAEGGLYRTFGDFNKDLKVDYLDLALLASNWKTNSTDIDCNGDGFVNDIDLVAFADSWFWCYE
ncbi:MAG: ADP-ribosylglycohydrolase family protein [Sedimentisphaeraceae bacterium JB056]